MDPATPSGTVPKKAFWAGWSITILVGLFLAFDAVTKLIHPVPLFITEAFARLGWPVSLASTIATVLLICTALYAIPQTSILGAILLTGYLGGAVAVQLRAGNPTFETLFPVIFGGLMWLGIYLRETRLRALVPLRRELARIV